MAAAGCCSNHICGHLHHHFAIYFLILVISTSSHPTIFNAQGRRLLPQISDNSKNKAIEDNAIFRAQIGSRPPQCDRRCRSCTHCQAIQVPTNPTGTRRNYSATDDVVSANAYARDDEGSSNYKPMSWKCKCGDLIFNP